MDLTIGQTIYAKWAVGPEQRGSGWLDPRFAGELDAYTISVVSWLPETHLLQVPGGGQIVIREGQFETSPR